MALPTMQTAICQAPKAEGSLPLQINRSAPVPKRSSPHDVMVKVTAVALNPNDHKMVTYFNSPGHIAGCDFSGIVAEEAEDASLRTEFPLGTRVCGALFPYNPTDVGDNGSFSQYCVVHGGLLVKVPDSWTDLQAASLGVAWSTISMALSDVNALNLEGLPTSPAHGEGEHVLVYGGSTASGTFALQMLSLMGYTPVAIASARSAGLVKSYGAVYTASYESKECIDTIKSAINNKPIRKILDCITDSDSTALCYSAMGRTGGTYACLEECPEAWRTRKAVKVKEVMGFEVLGIKMELGGSTYSRSGEERLHKVGVQWAKEVERLMAENKIKTHPLKELDNGWQSILDGLDMLRRGEVRGQKLVVKIT